MIAFWNRKEVLLTDSMERITKVRYALQSAGIAYSLKIKNLSTMKRNAPSIAQNTRHSDVMYYLYVNKKDEEQAQHILQEALRKA